MQTDRENVLQDAMQMVIDRGARFVITAMPNGGWLVRPESAPGVALPALGAYTDAPDMLCALADAMGYAVVFCDKNTPAARDAAGFLASTYVPPLSEDSPLAVAGGRGWDPMLDEVCGQAGGRGMTGLERITHRKGPTIKTRHGAYFDFEDPEGSVILLGDIAHALGHLCRFTGHTQQFYSVAEHSVHASYLVPLEDALAALMHDAAEAYVGDVSRPLKSLLPGFREIEHRVERAVLARFSIPQPLPPSVKRADMMLLRVEQVFAMDCADQWPDLEGVPMPDVELQFWPPEIAALKFRRRFAQLTGYVAPSAPFEIPM